MGAKAAAWVKAHRFWSFIIVSLVVGAMINAFNGSPSSSNNHPSASKYESTTTILREAENAPPASPASSPSAAYTFHPSAAQQRAQRRANAQAARHAARQEWLASNAPRRVQYLIRGTTGGATITYTSTGDGSAQRDIQVLPEWRAAEANLRPGDFAYVSAQNDQDYGTVSCKIIELTPYGTKTIAAATESSGAYAIAQCNGTVP